MNAQEELAYWIQQRAKYPTKFAPIPGIDYPMQLYQPMQRRARQGNSRNSAHSSINYSSGHTGMNSSVSNVSPIFPSAFPYFGLNHGPGSPNHGPISIHDIDALTAGAPMSPSANNFLPSGLLGDDELPGDGFLPAMYDRNLAIAQSYGQNAADQDPQSPISVTSQSPSLVSSPQESLSNIHGIYSLGDSERRSLGSTGSPYSHGMTASSNAGHSRRFGNLFNFNRQRGKNGIDDLPALGTLKSTQSQSFPLNLDQDPGASGSGRRKLTSSVWPNSMTSFLTRGGSVPIEDGDGGGTRKARRGVFGTKLEHLEPLTTVDRSPSPRPSSTYSHDRALPRPASDVNPLFGWPVNEASQQRSSPLGADWGSIGGGWSRNQSRRQSLQHGSTSNLSIGTTPLEIDDYASPYNAKTSQPAPIGTGRFKRSATPKLNPAAPTFTARFFARESRKTPKHEKAQELQRTASFDKLKSRTSRELADPAFLSEDSSPPVSRLSRDAHSVNTTASVADSHDSLDHTISATASETTGTSSSTPKESLMQKITRKSSSSKFVPWSKERSSIFSKKAPGEPSTPGEIDEDASSDYIGNGLLPAVPTTPNPDKAPRGSLSWSRVMGKNKGKKGEVAPSETSEMTASETDGAEEEDADVIAS